MEKSTKGRDLKTYNRERSREGTEKGTAGRVRETHTRGGRRNTKGEEKRNAYINLCLFELYSQITGIFQNF